MNQNEAFNKLYQKLNPQQKLAVDRLEGPVMVIAGPGTGKTQILGARIGKILLGTDTDPEIYYASLILTRAPSPCAAVCSVLSARMPIR